MSSYAEIAMLIRMLDLLVNVTDAKTENYFAKVGEIVKVNPA